jgi:lipopolysaccharide/colanic/teichoic acid biosynthesis glycosyltransferase
VLSLSPPRPPEVVAARGWYPASKRLAEIVAALLLLLLTAPLLLLALLLVKLTSRGPALYSQTRVGRGGRPFTLYKIRSMTWQCEDLTGACWSPPGDDRVTRVGRWLRRTHLDELPQLWNILRGDMSLIGPRPERPEFVALYSSRLLVRPGLTGLAQVQLPPDSDLDSVRRKLVFDLWYVQHCSWWLDCRIYLATLLHMLGVPYRWLRPLFGFPNLHTVEARYHALLPPPSRNGVSHQATDKRQAAHRTEQDTVTQPAGDASESAADTALDTPPFAQEPENRDS